MSATVPVPVPEWLTAHSGSIKPGVRPETRFVMIGTQPLYKLEVRPAKGRFICCVMNTVNGKRLDDDSSAYPGFAEAFQGGLEQLRQRLGW